MSDETTELLRRENQRLRGEVSGMKERIRDMETALEDKLEGRGNPQQGIVTGWTP